MKIILVLILLAGCASSKICRTVCIPGEACKRICKTDQEWGYARYCTDEEAK